LEAHLGVDEEVNCCGLSVGEEESLLSSSSLGEEEEEDQFMVESQEMISSTFLQSPSSDFDLSSPFV